MFSKVLLIRGHLKSGLCGKELNIMNNVIVSLLSLYQITKFSNDPNSENILKGL